MTVFNHDLIQKQLQAAIIEMPEQPKYYIGVDTSDANHSSYSAAYCLCMKPDNGEHTVLLCKRFTDEKDFKEEVEQIQKYFNAIKITETK